MKETKKSKGQVGVMPEATFTVNEDLKKYTGPEFEPPKLKRIREKFSSPIIIHR
jgi:hypothetical protein